MPFEAVCSVLCASLPPRPYRRSFKEHKIQLVLDKVSSSVIFNTGFSVASIS